MYLYLCIVMSAVDIKRYAFNASTRSIEAKTLDYLWEKAKQTTIAHRAEFYQLIWIEQGVLHLSIGLRGPAAGDITSPFNQPWASMPVLPR